MAFYGNSIDVKYKINEYIQDNGMLKRVSLSKTASSSGSSSVSFDMSAYGVPKYVDLDNDSNTWEYMGFGSVGKNAYGGAFRCSGGYESTFATEYYKAKYDTETKKLHIAEYQGNISGEVKINVYYVPNEI